MANNHTLVTLLLAWQHSIRGEHANEEEKVMNDFTGV